jgi:glycosyltransferase involved in cell wall biosynthesis
MTTTIDILLATYKPERFLQEQLDSLVSQSVTNWHLLVHEDYLKRNLYVF